MNAVDVGHSPSWVDEIISIAPVELFDTRELSLIAVHPDGCVTAWSPVDPSVLLMRKRQMNVTCVASADDKVKHNSLVWFGGVKGVECYRARRRDGRSIHMQPLYNLHVECGRGIRELQTDGNSLVAVVIGHRSTVVFFWNAIGGRVATAKRKIEERVECCDPRCIFGADAMLSKWMMGDVSSILMTGDTIWLGCTGGGLLLVDAEDACLDGGPSYAMRTAGTCPVSSLALFAHPSRTPVVVSGLENGDIILWSLKGALHLGHHFEHAGGVSAMTYVPWLRGICSVSSAREVLFWGWHEPSNSLRIMGRGVLEDDMGANTVRSLCAVPDTMVIACGAKKSHILHWRMDPKCFAAGGGAPPCFSSNVADDEPTMCERTQELLAEGPHGEETYSTNESERRNAEQTTPVVTQAEADERGHEILDLSRQALTPGCDLSSLNPSVQEEVVVEGINPLLPMSKMHLESLGRRREDLQDTWRRKHEEEAKPCDVKMVYPVDRRQVPEEFTVVGQCNPDKEEKVRFAAKKLGNDKGIGTVGDDWRCEISRCAPMLDKGVQVSSHTTNCCRAGGGGKVESGRKNVVTTHSPLRGKQQRGLPQESSDLYTVSVPPLDAFTAEGAPRGGANRLPKRKGEEGTTSACVAEALKVQVLLMETLLRNHRTVSSSSDPLLMQSTNILTDVYLMARDVLGFDTASAITHEALEGQPLTSEREVVCKLFAAICKRYRSTLLPPTAP